MVMTTITYGREAWAWDPELPCVSFINSPREYWILEMPNDTYSGTISDQYSLYGVPAYRIELRDTDPEIHSGKRAELAAKDSNQALGEYIYRFSVLLPDGGDEDYALDPHGSEIIAQWHNQPDPGEGWTSPSVALHTGSYYNEEDHYTLEVNYDESPISTDDTLKRARFDLGSFSQDKGKWVDWQVRVKWGWELSQDPCIQISKNGEQIFELENYPNTTNDQQGVKMKLGMYKWDWAQGIYNTSILHRRVIYFNNISSRMISKTCLDNNHLIFV